MALGTARIALAQRHEKATIRRSSGSSNVAYCVGPRVTLTPMGQRPGLAEQASTQFGICGGRAPWGVPGAAAGRAGMGVVLRSISCTYSMSCTVLQFAKASWVDHRFCAHRAAAPAGARRRRYIVVVCRLRNSSGLCVCVCGERGGETGIPTKL